jgi:hypothetical protein
MWPVSTSDTTEANMPQPTQSAFTTLDEEWTTLAHGRHSRKTIQRWRTAPDGHVFGEVDELADVITRLRRCSGPHESDTWLAPLMRSAIAGDELAVRTIVQAMLPMTIGVARRRHTDQDAQWHVIATLAEQIANFPLATHPVSIARHLTRMVRRVLWRETTRQRSIATCPLDPTSHGDEEWGQTGQTDLLAGGDSDGNRAARPGVTADRVDARATIDRLASAVVEVTHTGDLRRDHAELLLMIAAGHRIVDLASARGVGYDAMRKRVGTASAAAGRALARSALAA